MNTVGKQGKLGENIKCVVSVSMLTERWDANTVLTFSASAHSEHNCSANKLSVGGFADGVMSQTKERPKSEKSPERTSGRGQFESMILENLKKAGVQYRWIAVPSIFPSEDSAASSEILLAP